MDRQAREAKQMTKELPLKERLINFWYYKKWWVISAVAIILVLIITVYEISTTPQYDALVGIYTEGLASDEIVTNIENAFAEYSNDVNEDGSINVSATSAAASRQYASEDATAVETKIMSELNSGTNDIYVVDKAYYDFLMGDIYAECFCVEYDLSSNPEFMEKIGYSGELYLLVRDLYPSDEGDINKRASYNNAMAIYYGIAGIEADTE